jgi:hypothetical protein
MVHELYGEQDPPVFGELDETDGKTHRRPDEQKVPRRRASRQGSLPSDPVM